MHLSISISIRNRNHFPLKLHITSVTNTKTGIASNEGTRCRVVCLALAWVAWKAVVLQPCCPSFALLFFFSLLLFFFFCASSSVTPRGHSSHCSSLSLSLSSHLFYAYHFILLTRNPSLTLSHPSLCHLSLHSAPPLQQRPPSTWKTPLPTTPTALFSQRLQLRDNSQEKQHTRRDNTEEKQHTRNLNSLSLLSLLD